MSDTASLFNNGGSQAVRLPVEYRFSGDRVRIRRDGDAVILEPLTKRVWPAAFRERFESMPPLPDDFEAPEPLPGSGHRDEMLEEL